MKTCTVQLLATLLLIVPSPTHGQESQSKPPRQEDHSIQLDFVRVSKDDSSIVLEASGQKFVPWGFNYDHDGQGRLMCTLAR